MSYEYLGNCVDNPFRTISKLCKIIDSGKEIKRSTFLKHCNLSKDEAWGTISYSINRKDMFEYPYDFEYYHVPRTNIYYFTHSAIEFFFKCY